MVVGEINRENFSKLDDSTFDKLMYLIDLITMKEFEVDITYKRCKTPLYFIFAFRYADVKIDEDFVLIKDSNTGSVIELDSSQIERIDQYDGGIDVHMKSYEISFCEPWYRHLC